MSEADLRAFIAGRIRIAIGEIPLKGDGFAEAMGVSKAAASKWGKTGKITHHNLYRLAKVSKRPLSWFYPETGVPDESSSLRSLIEADGADEDVLEDLLHAVLEARKRGSKLA